MRSTTPWTTWLLSSFLLCSFLGINLVDSQKPQKSSASVNSKRSMKKVMAYYPVYNYRIQTPKQIDYSLYTDLLFFVAVPEANNTFSYDKKITFKHAEELAVEFVALAKQHNVKPIISFGGWIGSQHFSKLVSTATGRAAFANSLVKYSHKFGFAGLDLDWEYPNSDGMGCNSRSPQDTVNFGLLIKEIRRLWPKAQLSAAIGISGLIGSDGKPATPSETSVIAQNLDFVNLMAYDVFGAWVSTTGPLAPFHGTCAPAGLNQSVETGVEVLIKQGFKAQQIILGLPAYAKRLELVSPKLQPITVNGHETFIYQNHTKVTPPGGIADDKPAKDDCGNLQQWGGSFLAVELISNGWLSQDQTKGLNGYTRHFDECSGTPFLTSEKYFITYDDQFTSVTKAKWAKEKQLAGVYFFDTTGTSHSTVAATAKAL